MITYCRNKNTALAILIFVCLFFGSCISNKRIQYFQEKSKEISYTDTIKFDRNRYKMQVNDILNVEIKTRNEAFQNLFGGSSNAAGGAGIAGIGGQSGGDLFYTIGYTINDSGAINFPMIGPVYVEGLTLQEIEQKIEKELVVFQEDVKVVVRIGGLRFTLLGEFNRPGKFVVLQNQLTIFEAIAMGGDLKEIARRDKVTLVRQHPDGIQIHYIDVLDKSIIASPFYFIQPNDLLYVEPLKRRAYGVGVNGLQTLSTALSIITTSLLLINYFNR